MFVDKPTQPPKTSELLQELFDTGSVTRFIKRNQDYMRKSPLHVYLKNECEKRGVLAAHVIAKSRIERTFGHHIFSGDKNPSRDKVIQLAFGFEMDYNEAQELLKAAGKSPLYPKIIRDAVVIYALKHNLNLIEVQTALDELDLPLIDKEGRYE